LGAKRGLSEKPSQAFFFVILLKGTDKACFALLYKLQELYYTPSTARLTWRDIARLLP